MIIISRYLRKWYSGSILHVMGRGVRRSALFLDEDDYNAFYKILQSSQKLYECEVYCFCIMTNHFHLLIKTSDIPVGKFMQRLMKNYAKVFNQKYGYTGHVFDARFTSKLVETSPYFLHVSRYIHLNPVKAGLVSKPNDYKHSSYKNYVDNIYNPILSTDMIYQYFGQDPANQYREFVECNFYDCEIDSTIRDDIKDDN